MAFIVQKNGPDSYYVTEESGSSGLFGWVHVIVSDTVGFILAFLLTVSLFMVPFLRTDWLWPWLEKLVGINEMETNLLPLIYFLIGCASITFAATVLLIKNVESPFLASIVPGVFVLIFLIWRFVNIGVVTTICGILLNLLLLVFALLSILPILTSMLVVYLFDNVLILPNYVAYILFFVISLVYGILYVSLLPIIKKHFK